MSRAQLAFSARAFALCALLASVIAVYGWFRLHDVGITVLHVAAAVWFATQAHADATEQSR